MEYCSRCGAQIESGSSFCPYCGATKAPAAPTAPTMAPMGTPYTPVSTTVTPTKSSGAGLGMAIPGMIISILGLIWGVVWFFNIAPYLDYRWADEIAAVVLVAGLFTMPLSIVGLSLSNAAKRNGHVGGMSTAGVVMGSIGLGLHGLAFLLCTFCF